MSVFAALAALTVAGLVCVGVCALRVLAALRGLQEQLVRTRDQVEPAYDRLRALSGRDKVDAP
ncbi:hypothetical protein LP52_10490 [Streptomonospora alba]|uniref:Uncharacterized protein n=1 Tax=Streptomonospora alba TaxID=183763 RepID=A0A0C2G6D4_9ACTN|nr:hypothetical protein [Streptomonospora alba]KIH98863.1 hypothetical protein LP52_10490 [Streptomonospora alba]